MKKYPSQEYLKSILDYNQETGLFTWKKRPVSTFVSVTASKVWNSNYPGKVAGTKHESRGKSYRRISINNSDLPSHRLAWIFVYGFIPDDMEIDHINGDGQDNRMSNLRLVSHTQNSMNRRNPENNTSGHIGISFHVGHEKWQARIGYKGKRIHLGYFSSLESAANARKLAEIKYGYHKNHGSDRPL